MNNSKKNSESSWKDAIIDQLVICGIYNKRHEEDPRFAIEDLLQWNIEIALDPLVSEKAQKLIKDSIDNYCKYEYELSCTYCNKSHNTCGPCEGWHIKIDKNTRKITNISAEEYSIGHYIWKRYNETKENRQGITPESFNFPKKQYPIIPIKWTR